MRLFEDNIIWVQVKDGDKRAIKLFERHYSKHHYKDGRKPKIFVGPGQKIVLIHLMENGEADALFVWRKFISGDNQDGVNCAVFRNENDKLLSSRLIDDAEKIAQKKWPNEQLYTYVNSGKIKSSNPGYCFKINGWVQCGITKINKLIILEKTFIYDTVKQQIRA
jgi:hypothetical protein